MTPRLQIEFPHKMRLTYWCGNPYQAEENEFLLNHSRSGLYLALSVLNMPKQSRVGVMAYNCHTVMNAVWQAGMIPVFIDITRELTIDFEDLDKKIDGMRALIITHLFGIVNDVQTIKQRYPDLIIIEDCAHAYGIEHIYGDFATFSIGQGKLPSIGNGGILVVHNKQYLSVVKSQYPQQPLNRSFLLFYTLWLKSIFYTPFVYTVFTKPFLKHDKVRNPITQEKIAGMNIGVAAIYRQQKPSISKLISMRKLNALDIQNILPVKIGCNAFMAVCICDDPKKTARTFKGVETATHFAHCIDWAKYYGYQVGDCPTTEYMTKHLLVIPTYKCLKK